MNECDCVKCKVSRDDADTEVVLRSEFEKHVGLLAKKVVEKSEEAKGVIFDKGASGNIGHIFFISSVVHELSILLATWLELATQDTKEMAIKNIIHTDGIDKKTIGSSENLDFLGNLLNYYCGRYDWSYVLSAGNDKNSAAGIVTNVGDREAIKDFLSPLYDEEQEFPETKAGLSDKAKLN